MNLPVAVAAASMAWKILPESVTEKRDYSIDPVGMITLLMTAVSLIVGLQQSRQVRLRPVFSRRLRRLRHIFYFTDVLRAQRSGAVARFVAL